MSEMYKTLRDSPFWLGTGMLVASLALWSDQGVGGEVAISREIAVHGEDLASHVALAIAEMKQELTSQGCNQVSVASWSGDTATQLRVEVRCRSWTGEVPSDSGGPMGRANQESTVAGPSR